MPLVIFAARSRRARSTRRRTHRPGPPRTATASRTQTDGRITLVRVDDIDWLEATGSCVRVHAAGGTRLVRASLRELAETLDPRRFFRIHRSAIINLDRISELRHWSHGDYLVVLDDGTELRLTRSRREALEAALGAPF